MPARLARTNLLPDVYLFDRTHAPLRHPSQRFARNRNDGRRAWPLRSTDQAPLSRLVDPAGRSRTRVTSRFQPVPSALSTSATAREHVRTKNRLPRLSQLGRRPQRLSRVVELPPVSMPLAPGPRLGTYE